MFAKQNIKIDFGRAAANYDKYADLQKTVAANLVGFAGKDLPAGDILDLGSGTGFLQELLKQKQLVEIDIALPMCRKSARFGGIQVNGDIENLPFKDGAFSAAISSLALQWLEDFVGAIAEIHRVIQPGGILAFSILGKRTFFELSESLRKYGEGQRVNNFFSVKEISDILEKKFTIIGKNSENIINDYRNIFDLQRRIRAIGARKKGKTAPFNRKKITMINDYYLRNYPSAAGQNNSGIRATWEVHYFLARKK